MIVSGCQVVKAGIDRVWHALDGTEAYLACLPAITRLDEVNRDERVATIDLQLPAISGIFEGRIAVVERVQAPEPSEQRMILSVSGSGKGGVVEGSADIVLKTVTEGTEIRYSADVQVGGQIARLGQRMIGAAVQEMAVEFFGNLECYLVAGTAVTRGNPLLGMLRFIARIFRGLFTR